MAGANPWMSTLQVKEIRCAPIDSKRTIHAQVDGELAGALPLHLKIVPAALNLLMPEEAAHDPADQLHETTLVTEIGGSR